MSNEDIKKKIEERIKQLNKADVKFCEDRGNMKLNKMVRDLAREESNKITFARQELQKALTYFDMPAPVKKVKHEDYLTCDVCGGEIGPVGCYCLRQKMKGYGY